MNICFVGIGSIAKRHICNLKRMFGEDLRITALRSGKGDSDASFFDLYIERSVTEIEELESSYDAVFITNPTMAHYDTLNRLLPYSDGFFIEKPVFLTGEEDISGFLRTEKVFYVACPLRYTSVISYLKDHIDPDDVYSIRAISSSYLPDWRPSKDYRENYSADKKKGGGVSIDLIHEWDYIQYLFGYPKTVYSLIKKKSELEINSDDTALYIGDYEGRTVELHLDYYGRTPMRELDLITRNGTLRADLYNSKIYQFSNESVIDFKEDRDEFQTRELQHFFDIISGKAENDNDIKRACKTLRLARGIV